VKNVRAGDRDFTGYVANVLFDDWDQVWADAPRACAAAGRLCARLRRWLEPVWGLRLPAADYGHNDLNLSNVLTDGARITGVVDWDEFGLGSRALDLVALAVDCEERGDSAAADRLLARAAQVAGDDGTRCLVSYRIIGGLAVSPTSVRHTAIPSGMRGARRDRPSSTGSRRPTGPDVATPTERESRAGAGAKLKIIRGICAIRLRRRPCGLRHNSPSYLRLGWANVPDGGSGMGTSSARA
jgi:Phosphotransferase enzyme family